MKKILVLLLSIALIIVISYMAIEIIKFIGTITLYLTAPDAAKSSTVLLKFIAGILSVIAIVWFFQIVKFSTLVSIDIISRVYIFFKIRKLKKMGKGVFKGLKNTVNEQKDES